MNENREGVISDVTAAINLLISLGFLINWEKSVLLPSQSLEFLGLLVDSVVLSLALPSDKVLSMLALCRRSLLKDVISLHELSSLIGSFSWAIPTIPFAQAHYRQLQRLYIYHSKSFNYDLSRYVSLSPAARDDIRWWVENLSASNGLCFLKQDPDLIIYSDPFKVGVLHVTGSTQGALGRERIDFAILMSSNCWQPFTPLSH
jgi:hypothetical protein